MNLTRNGAWVFIAGFVATCFCCCGGLGFLGYRSVLSVAKTKDEALAYGDNSVKAICKSWDPAELESRASANLKRMDTHAKFVSAMVDPMKRYGPLKRLIGSSVRHMSSVSATNASQATTVVSWTQCEFEKGSGRVQLNLRKQYGQWSIDAMHVSPSDQ
jgi:hypothetical protein